MNFHIYGENLDIHGHRDDDHDTDGQMVSDGDWKSNRCADEEASEIDDDDGVEMGGT